MHQNHLTILSSHKGWAVVLLVTLMVCLGACAPKHTSYSDFRDIPDEGWNATTPVFLTPVYCDSALTFQVRLAVRNTTAFQYSDLNLVVDFIGAGHQVKRHRVKFVIADQFGNWLGSGFGAFYQSSIVLASGVHPGDLRRIVVWPGIKGNKVIKGIANVGIIVSPEGR